MPIMAAGLPDSVNYLSRLSPTLVAQLLTTVRQFYYSFAILYLISIYKISKSKHAEFVDSNMIFLTPLFMFISWMCLLTITVFVDLAKVGFNPILFLRMQIDPRAFTYLRSGLGPLTYLSNVSKMLILYISTVYYFQRKTVSSILLLILSFLLNIAGGSKSSMLVMFIFFLLIRQKQKKVGKVSASKFLGVSIIFVVAILASFYFMRGSITINSFSELLDFITSYAQEAYYSARVIEDFKWDINNIWIAIRAFFLTPIPRAIFSQKNYYGFYQECWRVLYQEGSVLYQSSTYGFLSEGHMLFGWLSPFISAVFINKVSEKIYTKYYSSSSLPELFILSYLFTRMYFYTRSGYLDATNMWALLVFYLGAKFFFWVMQKYTIRRR